MFSNLFIIALIIIFLVIFIFYKRQMLLNVFSLNVASSANQFQEQIEETAEAVIQRLEEKICHLEDLLEVADTKIAGLDERIVMVKKLLDKDNKDISLLRKSSNFSDNSEREIINAPSYQLSPADISINKNIINTDKEIARNNKRDSVLALAEQGYSSVEITKTTGISKSEIILLLQLNKK